MTSNIIQDLVLHFPFIASEAIEFIENDSDELIIILPNGETVSYDYIQKTIRTLPKDKTNMTEAEYKNEFGLRLRKIMYRKNITQEELSELTGIPRTMINGYLTGRNIPSFYKIDKIAKALDCSTDEFRYI